MMATLNTFNPGFGTGVTVAPGTGSARTALRSGSQSLCLTNLGTVTVYIRTGDVTSVATAADYPILASQQVTITRRQDDTHVAYITASGTGSLHIMAGEGF
jgi:hypothetical protein